MQHPITGVQLLQILAWRVLIKRRVAYLLQQLRDELRGHIPGRARYESRLGHAN